MKNKIFVVMIVCLFSIGIQAQRTENGKAVKATFGIMKGKGEILKELGATASLGISYIVGNSLYLIEADLIFKDFSTQYNDQDLYNRFYGMRLQGAYSIEYFEPFYLNIKIGGFGGFEQINKGEEKDNIYGIPLNHSVENFVYGVVAGTEVELVIWNNLSFVAGYSQYFGIGSKYTEWYYSIEAGFKYYF